MIVYFIDCYDKLNSRVFNFCYLELFHNRVVLCGIVFELFKKWVIEYKILFIILDNIYSNDEMQDYLKIKLNNKDFLLNYDDYFYVRCLIFRFYY